MAKIARPVPIKREEISGGKIKRIMVDASNVVDTVSIAAQAGINVMLWGPPGLGKSAFVSALAEKINESNDSFVTLIGAAMDPADVLGIPYVDKEERLARFAVPEWLGDLRNISERKKRPILFFDELTAAPPSVRATFLRILWERKVHSHSLPKDTIIMLAANPVDQAEGDAATISPALANRLMHIDWLPDKIGEYILAYFSGDKGFELDIILLPSKEKWEPNIQAFRRFLQGFLHYGASKTKSESEMILKIHELPDDEEKASRAWPSPRTWDMAFRYIAAVHSVKKQLPSSFDIGIGLSGLLGSEYGYVIADLLSKSEEEIERVLMGELKKDDITAIEAAKHRLQQKLGQFEGKDKETEE